MITRIIKDFEKKKRKNRTEKKAEFEFKNSSSAFFHNFPGSTCLPCKIFGVRHFFKLKSF